MSESAIEIRTSRRLRNMVIGFSVVWVFAVVLTLIHIEESPDAEDLAEIIGYSIFFPATAFFAVRGMTRMDESAISNTRYFRTKTIPIPEIQAVVITPLRSGRFGSELIEVRGETVRFAAVWRIKEAAPLVRRLEDVVPDKISHQSTKDLSFFKKLIHLDE